MFSGGQQADTARWSTPGELAALRWFDPSGWPLGPLGGTGPMAYLPPLIQRENVMALAPPGAGKTRAVLVPALLSERLQPPADRRSLVIVDPEGELYKLTGRELSRTHKIVVWNPAKPQMCNAAFDPFAYIPAWNKPGYVGACEQAAMVWLAATTEGAEGGTRRAGDPYWEKQPANVLKALLLAWGIRPLSATGAARELGDKSTKALLADITESGVDAARMRAKVVEDLMLNERAAGNVFSDLRERFMLLGNPTVAGTMQGKSVDFAAIVAQPTAVFVQVSTAALYLQPLLSVFIGTAVGELLKLTSSGRPLAREVRFIVDELGNLGRIYDLAGALATLRKNGIGFLMATQTRSRLADRYGLQGAESIMGTCGTVLALGGLSVDDATWVSRQLGTHVRTVYKTTVSMPSFGLHVDQQKDTAPLRTADAIRAMNRRMVVLPTRLRPFETGLRVYTGN